MKRSHTMEYMRVKGFEPFHSGMLNHAWGVIQQTEFGDSNFSDRPCPNYGEIPTFELGEG